MTRLRPAIPLLFALTGAAGLAYELVWFKLLDAVFGVTALATSTVLAVFMGGLGLGASIAARRADRWERPFFAYGVLETLLGLVAATVPFTLPLVNRAFVGIYDVLQPSLLVLSLLRAAAAAVLLLPPATLMGMTLPVLARAFSRDDSTALDVGVLYTINTLGALVGAAVAGFLLVPEAGLRAASAAAVAVNLFVGLAAMLLGRRVRIPPTERAAGARREWAAPALLAVAVLSGLTSLGYQVFWTRALVLALGNTVYAFAVILVAVLLGITLGSALATFLLARVAVPARALFVTQALAALAVVGVLFLFDDLPARFLELSSRWGGSFAGYVAANFVLAMAALLPATLLLGMGLPLVLGTALGGTRDVARGVGSLYAANTFGAIAGSLAAGFVVMPAFGVRGGILLFGALNALAAGLAVLLAFRARAHRGKAAGAIAAAFVIAVVLAPPWDPAVMTSGPFASGVTGRGADHGDELVYYDDGVTATVSVRRRGGDYKLQVDGRTEATGAGDFKTNTLLGTLPVLLHPDPHRVLVIGLGSGVTLGAVLAHDVEAVECAELSEGVVTAAAFFERWHGGALADPRVSLRAEDGRNHLLLTRARYDVIVSQPSNMWAAGVGNLFTREFFELCRDRLSESGILGQWIQGYAVSEETLRSVLRTISETFPSIDVWVAEWSDILVVASKKPGPIDVARIEAAFLEDRVGDGLRRAGVPDAPTLLSHFMMDTDAVRRFSADAPLHTDDDRRVEMREPRALADGTATQQAGTLLAWQADVRARLARWGGDGTLVAAVQARRAEIAARSLEAAGRGADAVLEFRRAATLNPADVAIRRNLARHHVRMGVALARAGDLPSAWENFAQAVIADSASAEAHANLGLASLSVGSAEEAIAETERAIALDPAAEAYLVQLGDIHRERRRFREAADAYRRSLAIRARQPETEEKLRDCLARLGHQEGADAARREGGR